ncbi:hypothetical protein [Ruminococcus flavefaciens]|uniref:hypothetical protein n=1 Tax=Ruminococcus flavefaciens TaxID=1265 RepID=UPI0026EF3B6F|nr:hypothetical protein [Ruminococcus flavefaciens]
MREEYMIHLQNIINHYDKYKEIAVPLKWVETQTDYCDASCYRREQYFRLFSVRFREGYLQTHFPEAFVQTMLTMMSYSEEWEPDCWAHISPEERLKFFVKGEEFYRGYLCFEKLRLQPIAADKFGDTVCSWLPCKTPEEAEDPNAFIKAIKMISDFSKSEAIWIGGYVGDGCTPDENWLAIQDDSFLFIAFHCSG